MSLVQRKYTICDECGGAIPEGADRIATLGGSMIAQGKMVGPFGGMDFCSTEHFEQWLGAQPTVPTPSPLYPKPPPSDA